MSQRNVCYIVFYHDTEPKSISDMVLRALRRKQFHYCTKWCRCAEVLFHPAVLSEIARAVKEKRLLHRFFFIATQSPHRIWTWSYELPDRMSSLLAAKVSTRSSPQKRTLFVMSQRNACYIDLSWNRACETSIQLGWLRGLGRHESRRHEMSLDGSEGLVGMWMAQRAWSA